MTTQLHPAQRPGGRRLRRALAAGAATVALVVVPAVAASAHVHVVPGSTAEGSYATVTFRVPTESDTASTTKVAVTLPTGTPLISVSTKPVPGWTATVEQVTLPAPVQVGGTTITKAPGTVTWSADPGAGIAPGQFQEFEISAGPLPAAGTELTFPTTQTYSDGSVVSWDQPSSGGKEPEHPVPAFTVTAASDGDGHPMATPAAAPAATSQPANGASTTGASTSGSDGTGSDGTARALGGTGLALGVVAVLLALAALLRQRRVPAAPAAPTAAAAPATPGTAGPDSTSGTTGARES